MIKRLFVILFSSLLLTSCAGAGFALLFSGSPTFPERGVWEGHIYTNEYLGLHFALQTEWFAGTDEDIAALMELSIEIMEVYGTERSDAFWERHDLTVFHEMMASCVLTGTSVHIIYERLTFPSAFVTVESYLEAYMRTLREEGSTANSLNGTTRIGNYNWRSVGSRLEMFGSIIYGRHFVNVHNGFARIIQIFYNGEDERVGNVLEMFFDLDDPLPEPPIVPQLEHATELIGTWRWDEDQTYAYHFYENGRGVRGFFGWHVYDIFWRTIGDDFLLIDTGLGIERWTFSITGDALIIENRQVGEMVYNFIRD